MVKLHQARLESLASGHVEVDGASEHPRGPTVQFLLKSPDLLPYSPNDILSPYSMTPINASTPRAARPVARPSHPGDATEGPLGAALSEVQKLEEEVRILAKGIDVLEEQRRLMRDAVHDHSLAHSLPPLGDAVVTDEDMSSSQHTAVALDPDPQMVLQHEVAALRSQLERVHEQAGSREAELLAEIANLRDALSRRAQLSEPAVGTLLDESDAEELHVGLSSPLAPTPVVHEAQDEGTVAMYTAPIEAGVERTDAEEAKSSNRENEGEKDQLDDDLPLRIPLPPSPDSSLEEPSLQHQPRSQSLHKRPPTPFAADVSETDTELATGNVGEPVRPEDNPVQPAIASGDVAVHLCCACAARLLTLEHKLEETKRAVAQRDEELVELRLAVSELRMATLGR
jgi:hypothetical protein